MPSETPLTQRNVAREFLSIVQSSTLAEMILERRGKSNIAFSGLSLPFPRRPLRISGVGHGSERTQGKAPGLWKRDHLSEES